MASISVAEAQFAYYFLQKLGGNVNNQFLLTAVVAWMRQESGGLSRVIGNNPFNIRVSSYAIGYRQTATNGSFAIFSSLQMGAYAAAQMLLNAGKDWRRYDRVVSAARGEPTGDQGLQEQAHSFIMGIVLSAWDAAHYGLGPGTKTIGDYTDANHLYNVWASITGVPRFTIPAEKTPAEKEYEQRKKRPRAPDPLPPPSMPENLLYLDPYEAKSFFNGTHKKGWDMGNLR